MRHEIVGSGMCRKHMCGAGMCINIFTPTLGWYTVHKRGGPVLGQLCRCLLMSFSLPFCTLQFSFGYSARELIVTEPHTPASISGCLAVVSTKDRADSVCSGMEQVLEGPLLEALWPYMCVSGRSC